MGTRLLSVRSLALAVALLTSLALLSACGGDDNADSPAPTAGPTGTANGTPLPSASPTPGSLEALAAYLEEEGLDGQTGTLTDPFDCAGITNNTDGDFCILNEVSIWGPGRVVLYVADVDDRDEKVWSVRVTLVDGAWEVTYTQNLATGN